MLSFLLPLYACGPDRPEGRAPRLEYAEEIGPHVAFLQDQHTDPIDYVMGLFDSHDIVILCERAHPEITQYELIRDLASDPRFINRVGHIFTELGGSNLQSRLDAVFATGGLSDPELAERLLPIYRDLSYYPIWDNYNFYWFIEQLYRLNESLASDRHVRLHLSDMPFDWSGMNGARYEEFKSGLGRRDRVMAEQITAGYRALLASADAHEKALVIMNFRHAFNDFAFDDGTRGDNVGRYLFEAFPGRVANVMLNSIAVLVGSTDQRPVLQPIQGGKWDAAFRVMGDASLGFDFNGSPFGADQFDYFPFNTQTVSYADVFTGFVFHRPLDAHLFVDNVPRLLADHFLDEYRRRLRIAGTPETEIEARARSASGLDTSSYENLPDMSAMISSWVK
ncbi:MAG: hypothetical protein GWN99_17480 [Gemmatimonadetes bacterium]|uniref:Uncharacterized protein n=1 Tax=Candidatus Kutchimonas denitrificans TaxID=3056748 RepID=A0AAE5CBN2_9BACT|nr:hypothetical protein [Gemmatimonadota bacterium]NIR74640.1 hypothetical protein [Candidatus Kutchimonas denitrificans]NIS02830.1 hypothetical protein [Gemmatimonadota bacterium]NIT68991.1 hypothetical protein [Gemmatimonadota bacterium]NIU52296.1 hypothetical protein [Gemmatimonadota bacterium]